MRLFTISMKLQVPFRPFSEISRPPFDCSVAWGLIIKIIIIIIIVIMMMIIIIIALFILGKNIVFKIYK